MADGIISPEDPLAADVVDLLKRHLAFTTAQSPPQDMHAIDANGLVDPAITLYSYRRNSELLAVGALKRLTEWHGELKSMHTAAAARGAGIGRAMLDHLVGVARDRGYHRLSLETGSMAAFAPARSLYAKAGFVACGPFADYRPSPNSKFMTLVLA